MSKKTLDIEMLKQIPAATLQEIRQWIYMKKMEKLQEKKQSKQQHKRRLSTIIEKEESTDDFTWKEQSLQCFNFEELDDFQLSQNGQGDSEVQLPQENEYKFLDSKIKK